MLTIPRKLPCLKTFNCCFNLLESTCFFYISDLKPVRFGTISILVVLHKDSKYGYWVFRYQNEIHQLHLDGVEFS